MDKLFVGDTLYGFCGGEFGSSYGNKSVMAIGRDWVVARDEDGMPVFAQCDPDSLARYTQEERND